MLIQVLEKQNLATDLSEDVCIIILTYKNNYNSKKFLKDAYTITLLCELNGEHLLRIRNPVFKNQSYNSFYFNLKISYKVGK